MLITITIKIMEYGVFGTKTENSATKCITATAKKQASGGFGMKPANLPANAITVRI